ncbi:MAG: hypothetical protein KGJ24_10570 [Burkholderiales bacterium]|nr:hypothetical protein [Burkholderiales bacterium]MDE2565384.1 hypothetical protein [Burkholderiales bacterium]
MRLGAALLLAALAAPALAKLPPPSEEAKAKAAEAAAKTAWSGKVDAYLLCKSMDHVAAVYRAQQAKAGKALPPVVATPPCVDPGPFVYTPAPPASAAAPGAAPALAKK